MLNPKTLHTARDLVTRASLTIPFRRTKSLRLTWRASTPSETQLIDHSKDNRREKLSSLDRSPGPTSIHVPLLASNRFLRRETR